MKPPERDEILILIEPQIFINVEVGEFCIVDTSEHCGQVGSRSRCNRCNGYFVTLQENPTTKGMYCFARFKRMYKQ